MLILITAAAAAAGTLFVGVNDYINGSMLDSTSITLTPSAEWQQVPFTLNPTMGTNCTGIVPGSNKDIDCGNMGANAGEGGRW